jgi:DNA-directed RNA polymerase sigma subunit (sigma70/sigma32)
MKRIHTTKQGDWNSLSAYLRDLSAQPQHSEDELRDIAARAACGDVAAQESLVRAHLRLVVAIAQQYGSYGLPAGGRDLRGQHRPHPRGPSSTTRASAPNSPTYASVWIKQRIHRAITKMARAVRIPVWRSQRLRKVARLNDELSAALGRAPTESELAGRLGLSEDELATLQRDRIEVASLDAPMRPDDEDSADVLQRIPDESTPDAASVTRPARTAR